MKKTYITPEVVVIDLKYSGMLCSSPLSGDFGGDADIPAKARLFDDWDDAEDDW